MLLAVAITAVPALAPRPCAAQSVNAESAAQQRYARGRELFFAHSYTEALKEFRGANELIASPNTRLYIARCERELGHLASAYVEFQRAAMEATDRARTDPRYTTTRDHARTEGAALEKKLAQLVVKVPHAPEGTTVTVGGQALPRAGWDLPTPIDPGEVEVIATAPGRTAFKKRLTFAAGSTADVIVSLGEATAHASEATPTAATSAVVTSSSAPTVVDTNEPNDSGKAASSSGGTVRTLGFLAIGVGVVGVGGFAVFGAMARGRYDDVKAACGGQRCDPAFEPQIQGGERMQLASNVSLAIGSVAIVAGLVMVATGGPSVANAPTKSVGEHRSRLATAGNERTSFRNVTFWGGPIDRGGFVGARLGF